MMIRLTLHSVIMMEETAVSMSMLITVYNANVIMKIIVCLDILQMLLVTALAMMRLTISTVIMMEETAAWSFLAIICFVQIAIALVWLF